jgi:hypothetical protein
MSTITYTRPQLNRIDEVFPAGMGYVAFRCYRGNAVVRFNRS